MIATQTWSDMIMYLQSSRWSSLRMCQGRIHCGIWGPELSSVFFWGSCEIVRRTPRRWQSQLIICQKRNAIEFFVHSFGRGHFQKPRIFIPTVCERASEGARERERERENKAQARLKQETKIPLIHMLHGSLLLNDFELFHARWLEFFIRGAYGRFIKTNCSILTITTTITPAFRCTCLKMNNLKSF